MSAEIRYLYLYRPDGQGGRQRWRFTVDVAMNIMREEPCRADGTVEHLGDPVTRVAAEIASPQLRALASKGVSYHMQGRSIHLDHIPDREMQVNTFFVETLPCPAGIPGCEDLRARYLEDRRVLLAGGCKSCELGGLQKKYRTIVEDRLAVSSTYADKNRSGAGHPGLPGPPAPDALRAHPD